MIGLVLKALNDLKSDMVTVKKILNISDRTKAADDGNLRLKSGWHASKSRRKTREDKEQIKLEQWSRAQRSLSNRLAP